MEIHGPPRHGKPGKALFEAGGDRLPEDFNGGFLAGAQALIIFLNGLV